MPDPNASGLIILDIVPHVAAPDGTCENCWTDYPVMCQCGGWIHAQFYDEDYDMNVSLVHGCDRCGSEYVEVKDA